MSARRRTPKALLALVLALAVVLTAPLPAQASFTTSATSSFTASTNTLAPPVTVSVTNLLCGVVALSQAQIRVTWLVSPSLWSTGYLITPIAAGVAQTPIAVTGRTTLLQDINVSRGVSYTFQVQATYLNWTSAVSTSQSQLCNIILG